MKDVRARPQFRLGQTLATPGALAALKKSGDALGELLERHRCGDWGLKAAIAHRYQKTGLFRKRYGADGFRTLVCTTGERRLAHLSQLLIRKLGTDNAARFGLTTFAQIASGGLLAPLWHVPGADDPLSLESWPPPAGEDPEGPHPEGNAVN